MEWKTTLKAGQNQVSPEDLQVCELCGTLNHHKNIECFTCGWRGQFSSDDATRKLAWLRLFDEFEEVRLEHVTAKKGPVIGDFGRKHTAGRWRQFREQARLWWQGFTAARRLRTVPRQQPAPQQRTASQNDTGVA